MAGPNQSMTYTLSDEQKQKWYNEFIKNNPDFSGSYGWKLQNEIEAGLTHFRENVDVDYRPWRVPPPPPTLESIFMDKMPGIANQAQSMMGGLMSDAGRASSQFIGNIPRYMENITGGLFHARDESDFMKPEHTYGQLGVGGQNPYEDLINAPVPGQGTQGNGAHSAIDGEIQINTLTDYLLEMFGK